MRRLWWWRAHLPEVSLYAGAYAAYLFTRGIFFADVEGRALDNAGAVINLQKLLGISWEAGWQSWAVAHAQPVVMALNWLYILTYWPVILATAAVLYAANRPMYRYYRRVVVVSLALALAAFALFPMAPPFRMPGHLMDTIQMFGPAFYGSPQMAGYYNTLAAMPSLHFTWTAILGMLFLRRARGWARLAGILYPVATFCAIIITGNHYILDAVAGGLLAAVGFAVVEVWSRRWGRSMVPDPPGRPRWSARKAGPAGPRPLPRGPPGG
jgi:hypothetical protein